MFGVQRPPIQTVRGHGDVEPAFAVVIACPIGELVAFFRVRNRGTFVENRSPELYRRRVVKHAVRLDSSNVEEIFDGYEVVVDGSDNFPTRYLVNDACVKLGIPNVHGSIFRLDGQVSVFWPGYGERRGPCYRCLFPEPPPAEFAPSCAEAGVLGVLPGVIGTLEAIETIKIVLGIGDLLVGRLLIYDALHQRFTELKVEPNEGCAFCAEGRDFPGYVDYEQFCSSAGGT